MGPNLGPLYGPKSGPQNPSKKPPTLQTTSANNAAELPCEIPRDRPTGGERGFVASFWCENGLGIGPHNHTRKANFTDTNNSKGTCL